MRILYLLESLGRGGTERGTLNVARALTERGHECSVAYLWGPNDLARPMRDADIDLHALNVRHRWNIPEAVSKTVRVIREVKPDILHGKLFFGGAYTALSRFLTPDLSRIVSFHNLGYDAYPADTAWRKARKQMDSWLMRHAIDSFTAVSKQVANHYRDHLGVNEITVVPNGVPVEDIAHRSSLDRDTILEAAGIDPSSTVLITPARFVPEKGHQYLVKAVKSLMEQGYDISALCFGSGPLRGDLIKLAGELGVRGRIRFQAEIPQETLFDIMSVADIFVLPSTHEGLPHAVIEAMSLELPVVASKVGGIPDVVEDGRSGHLIPPRNVPKLADAIGDLVENPSRRRSFGRAGREIVETKFSIQAVADSWETLYGDVLRPAD